MPKCVEDKWYPTHVDTARPGTPDIPCRTVSLGIERGQPSYLPPPPLVMVSVRSHSPSAPASS